jgi:hypothetical protein
MQAHTLMRITYFCRLVTRQVKIFSYCHIYKQKEFYSTIAFKNLIRFFLINKPLVKMLITFR